MLEGGYHVPEHPQEDGSGRSVTRQGNKGLKPMQRPTHGALASSECAAVVDAPSAGLRCQGPPCVLRLLAWKCFERIGCRMDARGPLILRG